MRETPGAPQPNSTNYIALWDVPELPNFGMFYADQAVAHALTIRRRIGAADGNAQIRVVENDFARHRFRVFNNGEVILESLAADAMHTTREAPEQRFRGAYWDGAASKDRDAILKHVVTGPGASQLRVLLGDVGAEAIIAIFSAGLLDLQLSAIANILNLQALTALPMYVDGAIHEQLQEGGDGETSLLLRRNLGGTFTVQRVSMGAVNSGGTGFRVLRVPN